MRIFRTGKLSSSTKAFSAREYRKSPMMTEVWWLNNALTVGKPRLSAEWSTESSCTSVARCISSIAAATVARSSYELFTDESWVCARFDAIAEGAGWLRTLRMERAGGRWRVTTAEQGDLDAALRAGGHPTAQPPGCEDPDRLGVDVDLAGSPLTNTLPLRRLGLVGAPPGTSRSVEAAWVLLPSLAVVPATQSYEVLGPGTVRYASGSFAAELRVDGDGYVTHYPGLAAAAPPTSSTAR